MEKSTSASSGGFLATLPMSIVMLYGLKRLPFFLNKTPPPQQITEDLVKIDSPILSTLAHFVFGAAASLPYMKIEKHLPRNRALSGAMYGVAVWAMNYGVLLKLFRSRSNAYNMSREKNMAMIASHIIWGITLAYTKDAFRKSDRA